MCDLLKGCGGRGRGVEGRVPHLQEAQCRLQETKVNSTQSFRVLNAYLCHRRVTHDLLNDIRRRHVHLLHLCLQVARFIILHSAQQSRIFNESALHGSLGVSLCAGAFID